MWYIVVEKQPCVISVLSPISPYQECISALNLLHRKQFSSRNIVSYEIPANMYQYNYQSTSRASKIKWTIALLFILKVKFQKIRKKYKIFLVICLHVCLYACRSLIDIDCWVPLVHYGRANRLQGIYKPWCFIFFTQNISIHAPLSENFSVKKDFVILWITRIQPLYYCVL